jgi:outer membrane lipoprotein carrier protein
MKQTLRLVLLGTAMLASTAMAGARDDLKSFTTGLKGLDGQFTQQVYDAKGTLKESSSGRVALSAPRLFRWEYAKPYPQLIVADGKKVWVYDPDLQQVTVRGQGSEEQNSPLSALIDPAKLDQQFNVKESGVADGLQWLTLTPKSEGDASFQTVPRRLVIPAVRHRIGSVTLRDNAAVEVVRVQVALAVADLARPRIVRVAQVCGHRAN